MCKEYFKESFDVIFEHLAGDGTGEGKVRHVCSRTFIIHIKLKSLNVILLFVNIMTVTACNCNISPSHIYFFY